MTPDDVRDIAADGVVKVARIWDDPTCERGFKTCLGKAVRCLIIDRWRARLTQARREEGRASHEDEVSRRLDPRPAVEPTVELWDLAACARATLTRKQQIYMDAYIGPTVDGSTNRDDVARALGKSHSSAHRMLEHVRDTLRQVYLARH